MYGVINGSHSYPSFLADFPFQLTSIDSLWQCYTSCWREFRERFTAGASIRPNPTIKKLSGMSVRARRVM